MPSNFTIRLPTLDELQTYALQQWEDRGIDSADLISILLELSFHVMGIQYEHAEWASEKSDFRRAGKRVGLYPTKLATNLSTSLTDSSSRKEGFVVETNFRMHACSSSKLHCEILHLFSRLEYQLPNLIVGTITKERMNNAFENGITAEQIISFLQQNPHPRVAEKNPSIPENVTDQGEVKKDNWQL